MERERECLERSRRILSVSVYTVGAVQVLLDCYLAECYYKREMNIMLHFTVDLSVIDYSCVFNIAMNGLFKSLMK